MGSGKTKARSCEWPWRALGTRPLTDFQEPRLPCVPTLECTTEIATVVPLSPAPAHPDPGTLSDLV